MKNNSHKLLAVVIGFLTILSCEKNETEKDNSDCYLCSAIGGDGSKVEKELCNDADKAIFRTQNAGREIDCQ